jgi:choline dehydrogenase-like flavoprotein
VRVNRRGHPIIDYRPGPQERAFLQHGIGEAARVHLAAGATDVLSLHTKERPKGLLADRSPASIDALCRELGKMAVDRNWSVLFSAHQMGTCRMGQDARTAVCDGRGEVFGVRGLFIADTSAFPAASGVNPMISVMGLAHHTAQGIKAQL